MGLPSQPILRLCFWLLMSVLGLGACTRPACADVPKVTVIDLHGAVWPVDAAFVSTQLDNAWKSGAAGVILDLDTTHGTNAAAETIKTAILAHSADFPIAAYVHDRALGPGALIAVSCKTVALSPGATLGGVTNSSLKAILKSTAEANGRNPEIAAAFAGADAPLPSLGLHTGDLLTLTAKQAQSVGYADVIAADYPDVLTKMGLPTATLTPVHLSFWTAAALWITQPWATILLLTLGLALVVTEVLTLHSWGIAGIIGGVIVGIIFVAHIIAGTGTWIGVLLFLAGIALILFETHVFPGHGLAALGGLILVFIGIYYALGGAATNAAASLATALVMTLLVVIAFLGYLPRSRVWTRIGQPMRQTAAAGYVSTENFTDFLGEHGIAITDLRPSGTAELSGERLPVVSEGGYIAAGTSLQVILVQGSRIVVRADDTEKV